MTSWYWNSAVVRRTVATASLKLSDQEEQTIEAERIHEMSGVQSRMGMKSNR